MLQYFYRHRTSKPWTTVLRAARNATTTIFSTPRNSCSAQMRKERGRPSTLRTIDLGQAPLVGPPLLPAVPSVTSWHRQLLLGDVLAERTTSGLD